MSWSKGRLSKPRLDYGSRCEGTILRNTSMLMQHSRTESIGTDKTKVESGWVLVAL